MKHPIIGTAAMLLGSGLLASGAIAQTHSHNPAIKDSTVARSSSAAQGANSFTEDQARGRIAKAGYTGVSKLAKDRKGVWRGMAMKGGKKVRVGLDYKGDLVTR